MSLLLITACIMLALALTAWFYRSMAAAHKAEAIRQTYRAEQAEASTDIRQALDRSLEQLQQKHRVETVDETKPQHLADRNDLDNDWSGGMPGNTAAADQPDSPAAAAAPRSSGD
jgi:hypothetical protein